MAMQFLLQITQPGSSMLNLYTKKPPPHETRVILRLGRRENQLPLDWVNAKISYPKTESMQNLVTQYKNQLPKYWVNAKISHP